MPFSRFYKLPPEKREGLLEVAAQEFVQHGFEDASINRILERAQMSKGAALVVCISSSRGTPVACHAGARAACYPCKAAQDVGDGYCETGAEGRRYPQRYS